MNSLKGKRAYPNPDGFLYIGEGEYGYSPDNKVWFIRPPGRGDVTLIEGNRVVENPDGTITVSGEILHVDQHGKGERREWRGTLIDGEWTEIE